MHSDNPSTLSSTSFSADGEEFVSVIEHRTEGYTIELNSYYRPRTFVIQAGDNMLVAAAAPLLSVVSRIRRTASYTNIHELYDNLVHEVNAFTSNAQRYHYNTKDIIIARYVLTSILDEAITATEWGNQTWPADQLTLHFFADSTSSERLFTILKQLMLEPQTYVELLELFYICLNIGLCHQLQHKQPKHQALIVEQLYQIIAKQREESTVSHEARSQHVLTDASRSVRKSGLFMLVSVLLSIALYQGFTQLLKTNEIPLLQQLLDITEANPHD